MMPKSLLKSWKSLTDEVIHYVNDNKKLKEIQKSVKKTVYQAQKDLNKMVDKDVKFLKKRFNADKKKIEKALENIVNTEIKKAQKFLDEQRKEIAKISKKVEGLVPEGDLKKAVQRTTKKIAGARKKSTKKKTASKVTKKTTKKKVAKKAASKTTKKKISKKK